MALVNAAAGPTAPVVPVVLGAPPVGSGKDSRWLTLEVCREFARSKCSRSDEECKYAHPPPHVDIQNGRVMCCFDSIKGKCQRKDPPCKYLHPPQHLKEILLQNGKQNLIYKNLALQAASLQSLGCIPQTVIPLMYEPTSGTVKQPGTILQHAGAPSVLFQAPSSVTAAGQYVTMLPAGGGSSSQQYLLPTAATHNLHAPACYSPAAAAGFLAAGMTDMSAAAAPIVSSHINNNAAWSVPGLGAGCYGLPTAAIHAVSYDSNHYQGAGCSNSSSSSSTPVEDSTSPPSSVTMTSSSDSATVTSSAYCQPVYYKQQVMEIYAAGGGSATTDPPAAMLNLRKRSAVDPRTGGPADGLILGVNPMAGGMMPVLKRPALVDAKTGLPVYRQLTTATSYPQMAAVNTVQQIQPQPFISFPIAGRTQILPQM